jgi:hypothetical protein
MLENVLKLEKQVNARLNILLSFNLLSFWSPRHTWSVKGYQISNYLKTSGNVNMLRAKFIKEKMNFEQRMQQRMQQSTQHSNVWVCKSRSAIRY